MITEALQHCAGIGPARLALLHSVGIRTWPDVLEYHEQIPVNWRHQLVAECHRCLAALKAENLSYFLDCFAPQDRWRILDHYFEQATFFDIETEGLHYDASITTIVCWHQGRLWTFVEHENLDDFLELLENVTLLVSFNGSTFDVPRVLDAFHIPKLDCGHLDLRWSCYHQGYRGGLKEITRQLKIKRPSDLKDVDGRMAVEWWNAWQSGQDRDAREQLIRYCAADVLLLVALARRLVGRSNEVDGNEEDGELWGYLPAATPTKIDRVGPEETARRVQGAMFGSGSPKRLRALHLQDRSLADG